MLSQLPCFPSQVDKSQLKQGSRVALDITTLTVMRILPREVDPLVYNMSHEDPGDVTYSQIGGLGEQIRELREVVCVCACVCVLNSLYRCLSFPLHP